MILYNYNKIIFFISLIYEIPSFILLFIIEIILILPSNKNKFQSSFFKIIFFNGIFDIISFVAFTFHHKFPNYGIFVNFYHYLYITNFDVRVIEFIRSFSSVAQLIGIFFLCFNRFTSIFLRLQYGYIWRYLLPLYYIITIILPVFFTFPILLDKMIYKPFNKSNINIGFKGRWKTFNAKWYNSYIISMILNLIFLTAFKIFDKNSRKKLNFTIFNFIVNKFSINKLYDNSYTMTILFPIVNDLTMFPNIWFLFIISSNIRYSVKKLFFINNKEILSNIKTYQTQKKK
ncbi:7TM GPCR, serpentine receptor class g (Srg) family-containing protein [Strongyloides ratti]|uniref:Serpentine receptor class gamma n=1 Tax=Strongyloides ratti TaxID=34506 RepID=A0A090KYS0_STRRB|nr:7TM GPCR, serpentine receptor class g (Srg) family-containing protein [Strongyloides ratti]CEF61032.1 7TM GPCR, serpentine receptor class g (Srg) family-containing protein [Strongyloides ratti]